MKYKLLTLTASLAFAGQALAVTQPLNCADMQSARTAAIEEKQAAVDESGVYEQMRESVENKFKCIVNLSGAMSDAVGSGGVFGAFKDFVIDTTSEAACNKANDLANQAKRDAQGRLDDAYSRLGGVAGLEDKQNELDRLKDVVLSEQEKLKDFYQQLQEQYGGRVPSGATPGYAGGNVMNPDNPYGQIQVGQQEKQSIFDQIAGVEERSDGKNVFDLLGGAH